MKQWAGPFRWTHSIRSRLVMLALVVVLPSVLLGWWMLGFTRYLALGASIAFTLAVLAAWVVADGIVAPMGVIKEMGQDVQSGRPVQAVATGISECDEVVHCLAQVSASIHETQTATDRRIEQADALSRNAEAHLSHHQRLEALGRLTGGVAHDFNNLLGVISNSGHLMLLRTTDPELTASIEVTLRAVEAGGRLTQHLQRFSGRQSVRPSVIPLEAFLHEAADLIRAFLGRSIELSVVVDPLTSAVFADPIELELALINLALNAREAIHERGHVVLHAAQANKQDTQGLKDQDFVVVSVTDDGGGISDAVAQRVFEPFFSTKGARQATGLGLSQVYGFCQQSGGTVRLNSTPGLGTSVSMVLPIQSATRLNTLAVSLGELPPITGTRVLVVEDNEELRDVTSALLSSFGCNVVSCASAQDAIRILVSAGDIDVMLTDVLMPGPMNGVWLSRHALKQFPGLPIVLISGHRGDVEEGDEFPFVAKPYTPETLVTALQKAIATNRVH